MQLIGGGGGGGSTNILGILNLHWKGFKKTFTIIESYAGMAELMVRYLVVEEALRG